MIAVPISANEPSRIWREMDNMNNGVKKGVV